MLTYPIQGLAPSAVDALVERGVQLREDVPVEILALATDKSKAVALVRGTTVTCLLTNPDLIRQTH